MYKMMAIDLDGTLLDDNKEISKENIYWINRAYEEKDILPVIATGRSSYVVEYLSGLVGRSISEYIIASNGAIVKDNMNNVYINRKYLTSKQVLNIVQVLRNYYLDFSLQTEEGIITNSLKIIRSAKQQKKLGEKVVAVEDIEKYLQKREEFVVPVLMIIGKADVLVKIKKALSATKEMQVNEICNCIVKDDKGQTKQFEYTETMIYGSTKANGIKMLAKYLNLKKEEIIVIGDGGNDIPMFEVGGFNIAMGNADKELKQKANYITATNNESGVAQAIKNVVFKGEI